VDKKKVIILILVVIGVLTLMMFGAGAYKSKNDSPPKDPEDNSFAKTIDGATGWLRADFDLKRLSGCSRSGRLITIPSSCILTIGPGSARPSKFKLQPSGLVAICFAFTRNKLNECITNGDAQIPDPPPAKFTVAKSSAFIYLECRGSGAQNCAVTLS
jgi:hypothetical protein